MAISRYFPDKLYKGLKGDPAKGPDNGWFTSANMEVLKTKTRLDQLPEELLAVVWQCIMADDDGSVLREFTEAFSGANMRWLAEVRDFDQDF
ncbi:hypothetical protein ACGFX8_33975 [Streptomyces sp. NPDC048362]|uniref:hypothetical protein n=1 Tax=Streptomyces sp. NPDC048362 TaxID=3365539 RepID=UPI00371E75B3